MEFLLQLFVVFLFSNQRSEHLKGVIEPSDLSDQLLNATYRLQDRSTNIFKQHKMKEKKSPLIMKHISNIFHTFHILSPQQSPPRKHIPTILLIQSYSLTNQY